MTDSATLHQSLKALGWVFKSKTNYKGKTQEISHWTTSHLPAYIPIQITQENIPTASYVLSISITEENNETQYAAVFTVLHRHRDEKGDTYSTKYNLWKHSSSNIEDLINTIKEFTISVCTSSDSIETFANLIMPRTYLTWSQNVK